MRWVLAVLVFFSALPARADGEHGALVTALEGRAFRLKGGEKVPLEAFERLQAGDLLALENAQMTLVFFVSARQESYRGSGRLEIGIGEGKPWGLPPPEIRKLPDFLVRQISRTPILVAQGRGGATRLRNLPTPEALGKIDENYKRLRLEATAGDLNPEMYRLSALFELRAYDALESALRDLESLHAGNNQAKILIALYRKALKNAQGL